jgi:ribosomal protein S18 acetylase RimI-like enzyme
LQRFLVDRRSRFGWAPDTPLMQASPAIALRPAQDADQGFLAAVYASTRTEDLAAMGFSTELKAAFLAQQFEAQRVHYANHFSGASHDIVLVDGKAGGRLIVDRRADEIRIVDLALIPAQRSRGVGGRLLQAILDEADAAGVVVRFHVERFNRAVRLYERLGFTIVSDDGAHLLVERAPGGQEKTAS